MKPLVHFLVAGGLAWLALGSDGSVRPRLVVPPGVDAGAAVDEAVLHRTALAIGLDGADAAARERMVRVAAFLGENAVEDRDALVAEARRLGLAETDVVVRRHLVQMMRLALQRPAPADVPSDAEVDAWIAAHAAELAGPPRVRLTHVYFARARRGPAAVDDATRAVASLERGEAVSGDAFLGGVTLGSASPADVARTLGPAVADAVAAAPVGQWIGPLESPWGAHVVRVDARLPGEMPPADAVRGRVVHRLLAERGAARAQTRLAALRARWDVVRQSAPGEDAP